ncbi:MAG: AraC family transcriptional regulator, partial [Rhodospirillales bacterium]|nr:AraC family transcriptional regulator [Rhodospirillales bacterium]
YTEALLSSVGIDARALADPEMRISVQAMGQLLELAAQQSKIDTFGLRLAETRSLSILGPIGLLLREEPTVRHAIRSLAKYVCLHNEAIVLRFDQFGSQAVVSTEFHLARQRPFRQGVELTIGVLFRVLQPLIGRHWRPIVCFTHEPPARRELAARPACRQVPSTISSTPPTTSTRPAASPSFSFSRR